MSLMIKFVNLIHQNLSQNVSITSKLRQKFHTVIGIQPLHDLREGCVPWNFRKIEFYVLRNFPKFDPIHFFLNNAQEKLQKYVSKCTIKSSRQNRLLIFAVLVGSSIYFLRDSKYISTTFLQFPPAGKNVRKVEITQVENYLSRGVTVFDLSNVSGSDPTSTFK